MMTVIVGSNGNDVLNGSFDDDVVVGLAGDDYLTGGGGNNTLNGGDGNDVLEENSSGIDDVNRLDGGAGDDTLMLYAGSSVIYFGRGSGHDSIEYPRFFSPLSSVLELGPNINISDLVFRDFVSSDPVNSDSKKYYSGEISIKGTDDRISMSDTVNSTMSNFHATYTIERINFADGTSLSYSEIKDKLDDARVYQTPARGPRSPFGSPGEIIGTNLVGGSQDDILKGDLGQDRLYGNAGNDILEGAAGNDQLEGGAGNDQLTGGAGNDTYRFSRGSGQDTLIRSGAVTDNDVIELGAGIKPADVMLRNVFFAGRPDSDSAGENTTFDELAWVLSIKGTTDSITVNGAFNDSTQSYSIKEIRFADGTVWNTATIKAKLQVPTAGDDKLLGYDADNEVISGGNGNDQIYGRGGNDRLDGGDGEDRVLGGRGNDYVTGGAGRDLLYGSWGDDLVEGGADNDRIYGNSGNDRLFGGGGNDQLEAGGGNDYLDGGAGDDVMRGGGGSATFVFGRGEGQDKLERTTVGDRVRMRTGIRAQDVVVRDMAGDMALSFKGGTAQEGLMVINQFAGGLGLYNNLGRIEFADGTVWKVDRASIASQTASSGNDVLFGGSRSITRLSGLGGDDTLFGGGISQLLDGGTGNDTVYGGSNADILLGGDGNDVLWAGAGDDVLRGQNGDDKLYGEAGNDTMGGGAGSDLLSGGDGNDTYQFGAGSQVDTIVNADTTGAGLDKLLIGLDTPITQAQVWLQRNGNDLKVALIGTADNVTVKDWYGAGAASGRLDALQMGNGKQLLATQVDVLVNAMAAFAPPAAGQTTLPSNYQAMLNPVIAANWN
jgi:Ca2+-binding RTX toxin-like protein